MLLVSSNISSLFARIYQHFDRINLHYFRLIKEKTHIKHDTFYDVFISFTKRHYIYVYVHGINVTSSPQKEQMVLHQNKNCICDSIYYHIMRLCWSRCPANQSIDTKLYLSKERQTSDRASSLSIDSHTHKQLLLMWEMQMRACACGYNVKMTTTAMTWRVINVYFWPLHKHTHTNSPHNHYNSLLRYVTISRRQKEKYDISEIIIFHRCERTIIAHDALGGLGFDIYTDHVNTLGHYVKLAEVYYSFFTSNIFLVYEWVFLEQFYFSKLCLDTPYMCFYAFSKNTSFDVSLKI